MTIRITGLFLLLATSIVSSLGNGISSQKDPKESDGYSGLLSNLKYRTVGPSRGGRVTAVAGHRAQPTTFYMGATGGGVWKTIDNGMTWHCISDGYFATGSIGAIRVADSDPNIVYVGTGSDGLRSNVIIGKGVYKSINGGKTWLHLGLEKVGNIGAVLIHPDNPDLVYIAAIGNPFTSNPERGVYRTKDGGTSWEKVLFISDKTGVVDLEFAPDNSKEIYATAWLAERKPWTIISGGYEGGVYKSQDGGDHWDHLTNGLPNGLRGKADLAVSAADPKRVYVLMEAPKPDGGLYRSDDRGASWKKVSNFEKILTRPFYYINLEAHPKNPDILWGMTEGFWRSEDGGRTWQRRPVPHGDNHDMWINPDNPNIYIQSNDGGANVTLNDGKTWSTQHNQPTAELYQVDVSDEFPYRLYAGQQDNTTISVPSMAPPSKPGGHTALWEAVGGCETGPAVPKPGDPHIVYTNCKGRFGVFDRRTGTEKQYYVGFWNLYGHNPKDLQYRFQRVAPIHVSPHNPDRVYHGSQYVHMTEDGGRTWKTISGDLTAFTPETQVVSGSPITLDVTGEEHFSTLYDIQESPHEPGVIWAGANDGPIHITTDGGNHWQDVTPGEIGPHGRVQNIEVSPHNPAKAYATILRYQLGDFEPYAFKTSNYGKTWTRITTTKNGIPSDHPVRVIREDPNREGLLYAGTEFGMFISFDDGKQWQPFQRNLPVTPVTDIKIVEKDLVLSTMGRGFWIFDNLTPLHEFSKELLANEAHLFQIKDPYRLKGSFRRRENPRPEVPQYPNPGVHIDYFLSNPSPTPVRLDILNEENKVIRSFLSSPQPKKKKSTQLKEARSQKRSKRSHLPNAKGLHRFTWNLRHEGLSGFDPGKAKTPEAVIDRADDHMNERQVKGVKTPRNQRIKIDRDPNGPMVIPGLYKARLTVGDWQATQQFEVKMDPRVLAQGVSEADVSAQIQLALQLRDTINNVRNSYEQAEQVLTEIRNQLMAKPIRYSQPKILDQLKYLYDNLNRADQIPGQDAYQRLRDLRQQLQEPLDELQKIIDAGSQNSSQTK